MSSEICVFSIPVATLKQACGSRDQSLIQAITISQHDLLSSVDEIDEEAEATCADALVGLVNGQINRDIPGFLYGYALKAICSQVGVELPNISAISGASHWIEEVDALLEENSIPIRLRTLVYAGAPIPIPEPDDYPFIGMWSADEIPAALAAIRSLDLADLDDDMPETLTQIRGWLEHATKKPDAALIGFLS